MAPEVKGKEWWSRKMCSETYKWLFSSKDKYEILIFNASTDKKSQTEKCRFWLISKGTGHPQWCFGLCGQDTKICPTFLGSRSFLDPVVMWDSFISLVFAREGKERWSKTPNCHLLGLAMMTPHWSCVISENGQSTPCLGIGSGSSGLKRHLLTARKQSVQEHGVYECEPGNAGCGAHIWPQDALWLTVDEEAWSEEVTAGSVGSQGVELQWK